MGATCGHQRGHNPYICINSCVSNGHIEKSCLNNQFAKNNLKNILLYPFIMGTTCFQIKHQKDYKYILRLLTVGSLRFWITISIKNSATLIRIDQTQTVNNKIYCVTCQRRPLTNMHFAIE